MILTWFKSLSFWQKVSTVLIIVVIIVYNVMSLRYEYMRHQWLKQINEEKTIIEEKKEDNEKKQDSIIDSGTKENNKVKNDIKRINEKSKKNAEAIYNSDYSDAKLDSLLTSYEKR